MNEDAIVALCIFVPINLIICAMLWWLDRADNRTKELLEEIVKLLKEEDYQAASESLRKKQNT